jgi:hypothetical protein
MKFFIALFLLVVAIFIGIQGYRLFAQSGDLQESADALVQQANVLSAENTSIRQDIRFYQNPDNGTKELQSKANYKKPGEQMLILVPPEQD